MRTVVTFDHIINGQPIYGDRMCLDIPEDTTTERMWAAIERAGLLKTSARAVVLLDGVKIPRPLRGASGTLQEILDLARKEIGL